MKTALVVIFLAAMLVIAGWVAIVGAQAREQRTREILREELAYHPVCICDSCKCCGDCLKAK